ncbi:MAG TPA: zinc transporter ZupT [candidate division WOR-3 bacterium]|uniref:Zinc transporter ZupT n=1 Tax=candidate division WOR-3 bacterium TaxID=2052148 RepID=A0A7V0T4R0_UNCW3|nr:zinc transporter ZupT [candidate division WOR-3 bacterium]
MHGDVLLALAISAGAALATTVGSFIAMMFRRPGPKVMAFMLGFAAGVMMFVSFGELLRESVGFLGFAPAVLAFFGGIVLMFVVDLVVPHLFISEHGLVNHCTEHVAAPAVLEAGGAGHGGRGRGHGRRHRGGGTGVIPPERLMRTGILIAVGIGLHNLPEGMATFAAAIKDPGLGLAIALAIALHNIPEGIAVAAPVYCATGSRRKAFLWSFLSGVAELVGAGLAALVLLPLLTETLLSYVLAVVAGLMVFISFDELIPGSYAYGREHLSVLGIVSGMAVMALSLWLLA